MEEVSCAHFDQKYSPKWKPLDNDSYIHGYLSMEKQRSCRLRHYLIVGELQIFFLWEEDFEKLRF